MNYLRNSSDDPFLQSPDRQEMSEDVSEQQASSGYEMLGDINPLNRFNINYISETLYPIGFSDVNDQMQTSFSVPNSFEHGNEMSECILDQPNDMNNEAKFASDTIMDLMEKDDRRKEEEEDIETQVLNVRKEDDEEEDIETLEDDDYAEEEEHIETCEVLIDDPFYLGSYDQEDNQTTTEENDWDWRSNNEQQTKIEETRSNLEHDKKFTESDLDSTNHAKKIAKILETFEEPQGKNVSIKGPQYCYGVTKAFCETCEDFRCLSVNYKFSPSWEEDDYIEVNLNTPTKIQTLGTSSFPKGVETNVRSVLKCAEGLVYKYLDILQHTFDVNEDFAKKYKLKKKNFRTLVIKELKLGCTQSTVLYYWLDLDDTDLPFYNKRLFVLKPEVEIDLIFNLQYTRQCNLLNKIPIMNTDDIDAMVSNTYTTQLNEDEEEPYVQNNAVDQNVLKHYENQFSALPVKRNDLECNYNNLPSDSYIENGSEAQSSYVLYQPGDLADSDRDDEGSEKQYSDISSPNSPQVAQKKSPDITAPTSDFGVDEGSEEQYSDISSPNSPQDEGSEEQYSDISSPNSPQAPTKNSFDISAPTSDFGVASKKFKPNSYDGAELQSIPSTSTQEENKENNAEALERKIDLKNFFSKYLKRILQQEKLDKSFCSEESESDNSEDGKNDNDNNEKENNNLQKREKEYNKKEENIVEENETEEHDMVDENQRHIIKFWHSEEEETSNEVSSDEEISKSEIRNESEMEMSEEASIEGDVEYNQDSDMEYEES